jgi:hypothetical protein
MKHPLFKLGQFVIDASVDNIEGEIVARCIYKYSFIYAIKHKDGKTFRKFNNDPNYTELWFDSLKVHNDTLIYWMHEETIRIDHLKGVLSTIREEIGL